MKKNISFKNSWRRIKVFMVWLQFHHFKNFVMFWLRVGIIIVLLAVGIGIWFTDNAPIIGAFTSIGCAFGTLAFYMGGKTPIKRLHKKYIAHAKKLRAKVTNLRSMF